MGKVGECDCYLPTDGIRSNRGLDVKVDRKCVINDWIGNVVGFDCGVSASNHLVVSVNFLLVGRYFASGLADLASALG